MKVAKIDVYLSYFLETCQIRARNGRKRQKKRNAVPPLKINQLNQNLGQKRATGRPVAFVFICSIDEEGDT